MSPDQTVRQEITELLTKERLTTKEISQAVRIREKDVIEHLEHIARSISKKGHFNIEPSVCRKCGFRFKDRKRFTSPSRCPLCKNEAITEQKFWIAGKR
jgi:predicted Zn-ribbon and HTH transcriptional regulator